MHGILKPLAAALRLMERAKPKAVAIDVILADKREDPTVDRTLADALCALPNVVLSSESINGGNRWEDPLPEFAKCAAGVGHVHSQPDRGDSRTSGIPLYVRVGRDRRWAI